MIPPVCPLAVTSYYTQDLKHYLKFYKCVQNIIDWGRHKHLKDIQGSLDNLLEENIERNLVHHLRMIPEAEMIKDRFMQPAGEW